MSAASGASGGPIFTKNMPVIGILLGGYRPDTSHESESFCHRCNPISNEQMKNILVFFFLVVEEYSRNSSCFVIYSYFRLIIVS